MADFFKSSCNSAVRLARARPPGTGDTAGRLWGPRGGRERPPAVPTAHASVGRLWEVVGLSLLRRKRFSDGRTPLTV